MMIHSNVKKIMKEKRVLAAVLSERTGLSSATIAKARQDDGIAECRLSTLARIAGGLGVSTKDLYEEDGYATVRLPGTEYAEAAEETAPYAIAPGGSSNA